MEGSNYVVISVSNTTQRDKVAADIYKQVSLEPEKTLFVQQDTNKIKIFHNLGNGRKILVRTYLIVIIPIQINLQVLTKMSGNIYFHLDQTIEELNEIVLKLQKLNGKQTVKKTNYADQTFNQLIKSLSESLS